MTAWTVAGDEEYAMRARVCASPASPGPFHNHTGIMRIPAEELEETQRDRERETNTHTHTHTQMQRRERGRERERERVMAVVAFPREFCQGR